MAINATLSHRNVHSSINTRTSLQGCAKNSVIRNTRSQEILLPGNSGCCLQLDAVKPISAKLLLKIQSIYTVQSRASIL